MCCVWFVSTLGPPGFSHDSPRTPDVHRRVLQTPPKFHEKTPRERQKERKWWPREGKQKREFLGSPPFGAPPFGAPPFGPPPFGPPPFGAPPFGARFILGLGPTVWGTTMTHQIQKWIGLKWIGPNWSNQDGQNGIGQSRSLPSFTRLGSMKCRCAVNPC